MSERLDAALLGAARGTDLVPVEVPAGMVELLQRAIEAGASDLHLTAGSPPLMRILGDLQVIEGRGKMTPPQIEELVVPLMQAEQRRRLSEDGSVDFSASVPGVGRFRCNVYRQRGSLCIAARAVIHRDLSLEALGLPPLVSELVDRRDGLILVTGPTGSGKSTTLAAMIEAINQRRNAVIITLEDPIEYLHRHGRSIINQREIGVDTRDFATGLRAALREDPDIILVGEMRDLETINIALTAAETGHLVLSTLHTRGAVSTIERVIDVFPTERQQQVRVQLAGALQAVISQQLVRDRAEHRMVLACELLVANTAVRNLIREGKSHQISGVLETGARYGMQTMEASLQALVQAGRVHPDDIAWRGRRGE